MSQHSNNVSEFTFHGWAGDTRVEKRKMDALEDAVESKRAKHRLEDMHIIKVHEQHVVFILRNARMPFARMREEFSMRRNIEKDAFDFVYNEYVIKDTDTVSCLIFGETGKYLNIEPQRLTVKLQIRQGICKEQL